MDYRLDKAPCGYFLLTPEGIIKDANENFLQMIQYEKEEVLNKHIESFFSVASKIMFHSLFFMQLQSNGWVDEIYLTLKNSKGDEVPVILNGNQVMNENEKLIHCVAVKMSKRDDYEKELRSIRQELEDAYKAKNAALKEESMLRQLLEATLFSMVEGIIVTDVYGKITLMNPMAEKYTGWQKVEAYGKDFELVFNNLNMITREKEINPVKYVLEKNEGLDILENIGLISKDGIETYISGNASGIFSKSEEITGVVVTFRDITKEFQLEKVISGFLNVNLDMLCVSDLEGNFHKVNKKFEEVLGYRTEEILGKSFLSFVHEEDIKETLEAMKALKNNNKVSGFTNRYKAKDGSYKYIEWHAEPGFQKYTYASARDITEKKMKEEQLLKISFRDQLTGLYNRHYFNTILGGEIENADLYDKPLSLAILDLDHFKNVNDTWGHPIGDELLKLTAETVSENIRNGDLLIRFGGEEFVLLMPGTNIDGALIALEKIRLAIENSNHPITGRQTVSIGVAQWIKYEAFEEWYSRADEALYSAKEGGRNRVASY